MVTTLTQAQCSDAVIRQSWFLFSDLNTRFNRFRELCEHGEERLFFWFCAQRDAFVNREFDFYTGQLDHAHIKLIQIAEIVPGALPQPTLLRRWNSALYGDFLSAYSRHVDWETALLASLQRRPGTVPDRDFWEQRRREYFIHSWAHVSASRMNSHRLTQDQDRLGSPFGPFRSIRSAFFYPSGRSASRLQSGCAGNSTGRP